MIRKQIHFPRKLFQVAFLSLSFVLGSAAVLRGQTVIGARELSMGSASTALQQSRWAMFSNPALMSRDERSASFFGVRYFGFSEITDMAFSLSYPTKIGVLGAGAHRYGFELYNESRIRLGYKNSILGFHYGFILNYSHVAQDITGGSAGALGVDLGIAAPILPTLWFGAKATNVNQPEYGSLNNEKLPRDLSIGLYYRLSEVALFSADLYKDVQFPLSYRGGVEVTVIGALVGRAGITTEPRTFSAGFGYEGAFWSANVAVQRHKERVLGYSPALDFQITW